MIDATRTTTDLLNGLHDAANDAIWSQFDARYRPILVNFARKLGLNDADAADVAQETLARFVSEYRDGKYSRERGRLRSWLIGIARYRVLEQRRQRASKREYRGDSAVVDLQDDQTLTQMWEAERRAVVLRQAMELLRTRTRLADSTIRAFELLVTQHMSPAAVAESLGISTHDVYLAKNRCASKLRELIEQIETAYEGD